jgi:hypothetical protein
VGKAMTNSIWERRAMLDKERRKFMQEVMHEFDIAHYKKLQTLQEECAVIGHNMRFTHLGPLGDPWYSCTMCHKSHVELNDKKESHEDR